MTEMFEIQELARIRQRELQGSADRWRLARQVAAAQRAGEGDPLPRRRATWLRVVHAAR